MRRARHNSLGNWTQMTEKREGVIHVNDTQHVELSSQSAVFVGRLYRSLYSDMIIRTLINDWIVCRMRSVSFSQPLFIVRNCLKTILTTLICDT